MGLWERNRQLSCKPQRPRSCIRVSQVRIAPPALAQPLLTCRFALTAVAKGFSKPTYSYNVGGGRIIGEGSNVTWDLYDAGPGFYRAIVEVQDNKKHRAVSSVDVKVHVLCGLCPFTSPVWSRSL